MGKIKNIVFDFGGVFIDWNQHYLYDKYFSTQEESDWFCSNVCNREWCEMTDSGIGMPEATRRRIALFPQYADAINTWTERFLETCNGIVPGMLDLVLELKRKGYRLYGKDVKVFPWTRTVECHVSYFWSCSRWRRWRQ